MAAESGVPGSFFYVLEDPVRILFVDDDPIMREFALVHLASEKAQVVVGADGLQALEAAGTGEFDVLLLDLEMGGMDGFEVLKRLRADERTRRLPILAMTGREEPAAIDRAFQAGATSFLVKPINWRLLSYQVRYVHRTHSTAMGLLRQRAEARADAERAGEALRRLATEGVELIRAAFQGPPEIRRLALDYVRLLEETAGAAKAEAEDSEAGPELDLRPDAA